MTILEAIKKALTVDGVKEALGEDAVKLLEAFKPQGGDAAALKADLQEAKATNARILEEKKKAAARVDELTAEIEELKAGGLSDLEKIQRDLEKERKAREAAEAKAAESEKEKSSLARTHALTAIGRKVKFLDAVPAEMAARELAIAFKDVEDLADEDTVAAVLESFKESHKGLILAEGTAQGAGTGAGSGDGTGGGGPKSPEKQTDAERLKHLTGRNK